jgi:lysozyme
MERLAAVLLWAALGAGRASAQDFANTPALPEELCAISARTASLGRDAAPTNDAPRLGHHRAGHASAPAQSGETPDVSRHPVRGVDVSSYDGAIQWTQVRAAGISFAFIKATEGDTFVDRDFAANWKEAAGAGVLEGAYHFYDFCDAGADQADHFIKTVPATRGALPMVIDLEQSDDCATMPAKGVFLPNLAAFVAKVEAAYGLEPVLYVNLSIYNAYLSDSPGAYKLWIADPTHVSPAIPAGADWTFWQYSWHGSIPGIGAQTDLDVFNGDAPALTQLTFP